MRYLLVCLVVAASMYAEETVPDIVLPPAVERAMERYESSMERAQQELLEAQAEFQEDATKAQASLVSSLERSINSRLSIPEQVAIYRLILAHDTDHQAARQFFGVLGNLDETLAAIEEEAVDSNVTTDILGNPVLTASPIDGSARSNGKGQNVTIDSTSPDGGKLGSFKEGQTLTIQYVSGEWTFNKKAGNKRPIQSPDIERTSIRYGIALFRKDSESNKWIRLAVIPVGTAEKRFSYSFERDVDHVALRMMDNTYGNNVGSVVYRVAAQLK